MNYGALRADSIPDFSSSHGSREISIINAIGLALLSGVPALRYQFFTEHELLTRSVFYCSNQDRTSAFRG